MRSISRPVPTLEDQTFKKEVFRLWPLITSRVIASSISVLSGETLILVSATTNLSMNLPVSTQNNGAIYVIQKLDSTSNTVLVSQLGSENIDGVSNYSIISQSGTACFLAEGSTTGRWVKLWIR